MALLLLPALLGAQLHKLDRPVDSPLWWTLTDEVTPAELKRLHSDRSLSLERYDAAVEAALERPLPERGPYSRECLLFYFNGDLTPELQPMWQAFEWFFAFYTPGEHASEENVLAAPRDLRGFGVSPSGVDAILNAASATQAEFESLMRERGPKVREMTILLRKVYDDPLRAAAILPEGQLYDAVLRKDYDTVASVVGRPEGEIRALVDSHADWDVSYALIAEALPRLKEEVTEADLIEAIAATRESMDTERWDLLGKGRLDAYFRPGRSILLAVDEPIHPRNVRWIEKPVPRLPSGRVEVPGDEAVAVVRADFGQDRSLLALDVLYGERSLTRSEQAFLESHLTLEYASEKSHRAVLFAVLRLGETISLERSRTVMVQCRCEVDPETGECAEPGPL